MNTGKSDSASQKIILEYDPIVLDSTNILMHTADELITRNGKPFSDTTFFASYAGRDKRVIFKFYDKDSKVIIRELNWNINDSTYLLIWYSKRDTIWFPFTYDFRDKRAEY